MPIESSWSLVVPTKRTEVAKSRLEPTLGAWRPRLARAFAVDTIGAARSCALVDRIVVVRDDARDDPELDALGAIFVQDPSHGRDMNAAIDAGLRVVRIAGCTARHGRVAVLTADLPALRSGELADALERAADLPFTVVADTEGIGTTMLASTRPLGPAPRFGGGSFARHVEEGASPLTAGPGLSRDIDLPEHLVQAVALGVGPSTAAVLDEAGLA